MIRNLFDESLPRYTCSRTNCLAHATAKLLWRNPKIHSNGKTKIWLACPKHREYLFNFLAARDFPVEIEEITEL
ncbi:hypothetical protein [Canibacter zhoujuaniae]|uniref:hypothetical protein n=1 Tax=Canibacter zhoujuaniae TaxID=2708343 RepID=UPI001FBA7548|nr:hypothetical protein [Canibacter zhoujuaniae]